MVNVEEIDQRCHFLIGSLSTLTSLIQRQRSTNIFSLNLIVIKRALFYFYRRWVNFKLHFPNIFLYLIFISILKVIFIKNKSFKFVKILHWICFSFFQKKFSLNFFYRLNVEIIRWLNVISTLTSRYDQIETVLINGLNVVVVDTQFNDIIFGSTNLTSTLANPEYKFDLKYTNRFYTVFLIQIC